MNHYVVHSKRHLLHTYKHTHTHHYTCDLCKVGQMIESPPEQNQNKDTSPDHVIDVQIHDMCGNDQSIKIHLSKQSHTLASSLRIAGGGGGAEISIQ